MIKGFVTMATGDERYYKMALNLLQSYKLFTNNPYRFAIIADRKNEYTEHFDDVIIIGNPQKNYMDKIRLLELCPYDENIFIDADCTAYKDLNIYWDAFKNADDFSVFGKALPLDSKDGWFEKDGAGKYKDVIHFVTHLHGVIYFIRPGKTCKEMLKLCYEIIENYNDYNIPYFKTPADESVFALAIAIMNLKPTERKSNYYIFMPMAKELKADIVNGLLEYKIDKDPYEKNGVLLHWANVNTKKALYKKENMCIECMASDSPIDTALVEKQYKKWKSKDDAIEKRLAIKNSVLKFAINLKHMFTK